MSNDSNTNLIVQNPWGEAGPLEMLEQVAGLTGKFMSAKWISLLMACPFMSCGKRENQAGYSGSLWANHYRE